MTRLIVRLWVRFTSEIWVWPCAMLVAVALLSLAPLRRLHAAARSSPPNFGAVADQLLAAVHPSHPENGYFPPFATEKLHWLHTQASKGALSILLLHDIAKFKLSVNDLMASGTVNEKELIVIAQPRFIRWLDDGGRTSAPFTEQQRNDFMLGLVHEVVHLQRPKVAAGSRDNPLHEESRTWREVDLNVVRHLRRTNHRMHSKFLQADDALSSCGDQLPCVELAIVIGPND